MAYNPNLYNPYIQQQQPTNGIITVNNRSSVENYPLPPSSVSPPMFLVDDDIFYVKSTDGGGAARILRYRFTEEPEPEQAQQGNSEYVTKKDFDDFANMIMEALDGKQVTSSSGKQ